MTARPVHPQPSDHHLNLSLSWGLVINFKWDDVSCYGLSRGGVDIPAGIEMCNNLQPSPNQSGRGVVVTLMRVDTTTSGLSTPAISLMALPGVTPNKLHYPLPQPMLCGGYTTPKIVVINL